MSSVTAPDTPVKKSKDSMTILELQAQNVKRLTAVRIKTDGHSIVVAGENEAGKSSVLDAIEMALRGKAAIPAQPIRAGADSGSVTLNLGDIIVTRTFTPGGGSLKVVSKDGLTYPSPQAFLEGLFGKRSLDPLAFAEQDNETQAITLRRLAKLDTTGLDLEYQKVFDDRTLVNREVTQVKGAVAKATRYQDAPSGLADATAIAARLQAANALAESAVRAESAAEAATVAGRSAEFTAQRANEQIDRLRAELEAAELTSLEADQAVMARKDERDAAQALAVLAASKIPDRFALQAELQGVEATNNKVRVNQVAGALDKQLSDKEVESAALTAKLNRIEVQKADMLTNAQFPIEGLGLNVVTGVTWNGLPFSQASQAVRIRVSVAIAMALHPKLNVLLVRNGNDLGAKNLHLLAQAAEEAGCQLWLERIAGGEGLPTVVIEDGTVAESTREAAHV